MLKPLQTSILLAALTACGPQWASIRAPGTPCPQITATEYDAALAGGAARGVAVIHEGGMVTLDNGPGVSHCATYSAAMRPCRRPNDYVIRYTLADGQVVHVRVPAQQQYRLNVHARPTTCEMVNP